MTVARRPGVETVMCDSPACTASVVYDSGQRLLSPQGLVQQAARAVGWVCSEAGDWCPVNHRNPDDDLNDG